LLLLLSWQLSAAPSGSFSPVTSNRINSRTTESSRFLNLSEFSSPPYPISNSAVQSSIFGRTGVSSSTNLRTRISKISSSSADISSHVSPYWSLASSDNTDTSSSVSLNTGPYLLKTSSTFSSSSHMPSFSVPASSGSSNNVLSNPVGTVSSLRTSKISNSSGTGSRTSSKNTIGPASTGSYQSLSSSTSTQTISTPATGMLYIGPVITAIVTIIAGETETIPMLSGGDLTAPILLGTPVITTIDPTGTEAKSSATEFSMMVAGLFPVIQAWIKDHQPAKSVIYLDWSLLGVDGWS